MADTITVLDGLQFQKETTSDVYTQDHATNSAVYQQQFKIPFAYKAARVIYNGAFDPDGGRVHYRTKLLRVTAVDTLAKTANQGDEWVALTPPAVAKSSDFDTSASYQSIIAVDVCQSSVTANTTGVKITVQGRKEDSLEEWQDLVEVTCLALGVAKKSDFGAQEAVGQTTLTVTNPAAGGLDNLGKLIFLEDTATIGQCEIAYLVSQTGD